MAMPFHPSNMSCLEHNGRIDCILYESPAQDFIIIKLEDGAVVMGNTGRDQFERGVMYRFLGRWENDATRGPRFRFSTFIVRHALSRAGVVKYLTECCDGVGVATANKIFDKFTRESVEALRVRPLEVAAECLLEPEVCVKASKQLERGQRFEETKVELFGLFDRRGFWGKLINQCIEKWNAKAPEVIKRNPFCLLGMPSAGFKRCDRLWIDLGLPPTRLKRSGLCAWNLVRQDGTGHTWLSGLDVAQRLAEQLPGVNVKRALQFALRTRKLQKHRDDDNALWLSCYERAASEDRLAAAIALLQQSEALWPTEEVPVSQQDGDRLPSRHQVEKLIQATRSPVGLFLGGPGTGKTHTLAFLIKAIIQRHGLHSIRVCAPTGKAANRATQALAQAGIDLRATTIHSLLGRSGHDGDGWGFLRNKKNPLDCQFLIVDETSMCDVDLLASLFDAVPVNGQVLLVGDPYQLPPVGHGAPQRDMIKAARLQLAAVQQPESETYIVKRCMTCGVDHDLDSTSCPVCSGFELTPHTQLDPKIVFRSILAWSVRYPRVHWFPAGQRRLAEVTTFRLLERFLKEEYRAKETSTASEAA